MEPMLLEVLLTYMNHLFSEQMYGVIILIAAANLIQVLKLYLLAYLILFSFRLIMKA